MEWREIIIKLDAYGGERERETKILTSNGIEEWVEESLDLDSEMKVPNLKTKLITLPRNSTWHFKFSKQRLMNFMTIEFHFTMLI